MSRKKDFHILVRISYLLYLALMAMVIYAIAKAPLVFKESNIIVEKALQKDILYPGRALDVEKFISSIPYKADPHTIYTVDPALRYKKTIKKGDGNCSNMAFGAAYYLQQQGIDYEIIHFLARDGEFLRGQGHTTLRTRYVLNGEEHTGIVSVFSGGIPRSSEDFMHITDLENGTIQDPSLLGLNSTRTYSASSYYSIPILSNSVIGRTPAADVNRYFAFMKMVYIPLGDEKVEKYIYDALVLFTGFYPKIYVKSIRDLFDGYEDKRLFFIFLLWVLRSAIFFVPLVILFEIRRFLSRHKVVVNSR